MHTSREAGRSPLSRRVETLIAIAAGAWIVHTVLGNAFAHSRVVVLQPLNGSFQSFDALRRLALGQTIGRDFDVYLGLGPVYLMRAATLVFGDDFLSSVRGVHVLTLGFHALVVCTLARMVWLRIATSLVLGALAATLAADGRAWWLPKPVAYWLDAQVYELYSPGNSVLGLRCAIPLLVALAFVAAWRRAGIAHAARWRRCAIVIGVLAGAAFVWSNDYGPPTGALVLLCAWTLLPREITAGRRLAFAALSTAAAIACALALAALATRGAVATWLEYNWVAVAGDQRWYFVDDRFRDGDPPFPWREPVVGFAAAALYASRARTPRAKPCDALLAFVVASTAAAGMLASLARPEARYFLPLHRLECFALPDLVLGATWPALRSFRDARVSPGAVAAARRVLAGAFLVAVVALCGFRAHREGLRGRLPAPDERHVAAPELGGAAAGDLDKLVVLGRTLRADLEQRAIPRERRLMSTYASALELLTDAIPPTRDDYVIHALGRWRRERFVADLARSKPAYAVTIRPSYSRWEEWVRRGHWDLYRALVRDYEPFDQTEHFTIWRPRAAPREEPASPAACAIGDGGASVLVTLPCVPDVRADRRYVVEVEIERNGDEVEPPWTPFARCVRALDESLEPALVFGLPPWTRRATFPMTLAAGESRRVTLRGSGAGAPVTIARASARVFADALEVDGFELSRLVAVADTDASCANGVARDGASFRVRDASDLRGLAAGRKLRFAGTGERAIAAIDGSVVHVRGAPLDPARDGWPSWIEVVRD